MESYELELNSSDIGEIIEIVRIQHLKMNDDLFCSKIGISPKTLFGIEQGKSPHGMMVLKKMHNTFPNVNIRINVDIK
jgi:DNA-binding XRE family transcriptional regulator